ncbi:MAG TPA: dTMP kinase, partial [Caldithrix sp.]|nr:dTMP kinase [Caldithrix sp.]
MNSIDASHFISFEGIDFSGKSTQISLLKEFLEENHYTVYFLREPGDTEISEKIRQILLDKNHHCMNEWAEIFLYSAARVQLVAERIIPLLKEGQIVIADRYVDSTTAYQGYGRQLDLDVVKTINQAATFGLLPGITFYLELTPDELFKRMNNADRTADRLETAGIEFFKRVFNGYKQIANLNKQRFCVIDAVQSI